MTDATDTLRAIARSADIGERGRVRNLTRVELINMARTACDALSIDYSIGVIDTMALTSQQTGAKSKKDDWHKPRSQGDHLTADEIERIRIAFKAGRKAADIARELQCSSRIALKYFQQFRDGKPTVVIQRFRPILQNRRHKPNFEI